MRIRIEGPSSPFQPERLQAGVVVMELAGHTVDLSAAGPSGRHAYLNGGDVDRRRSLEAAFRDDVDIVWLARGGYGLTRIVDDLMFPDRLPLVVGFSDATALFGRMTREGYGNCCVHGPLATTLAAEPEESIQHLMSLLAGEGSRPFPIASSQHTDVDVSGHLFVGNLVVLAALAGTPSMPDLRGKVLILEEVGERPYRIDRLLTQLMRAGAFDGVKAIVVGHLTGCDDAPPKPEAVRDPAPTAREVFIERCAAIRVPVAFGMPVGHEAPNFALPLAWTVRVQLKNGAGTFSLPLMPDGWPPTGIGRSTS